jgi:hypothetical protein
MYPVTDPMAQRGEGDKRYSSTLLTSAIEGGGWSAPRPGRFTPEKDPVPIDQEAGFNESAGNYLRYELLLCLAKRRVCVLP